MRKYILVYALACSLFCVFTHADLLMKVTVDDTVLTMGQTTTVRIFGFAEEAAAGNGLYDWQVNAAVDTTGIVQAVAGSAVALEPAPVDPGSFIVSENIGSTGNVDASAAIQLTATESGTGVGGYSELFNFQVEAIGLGSTQYSLTNILGDLFNFTVMYDEQENNVVFDATSSVGQISVVPEPSSLLILSGLGMIGYLRRKK